MTSRRVERVAQRIHQEISGLILTEVKDPVLSSVQINGVDVSPDLQIATVNYTVIGEADGKAIGQALRRAQGFLRQKIARTLQLRRAPELRFKTDVSLDRGLEMEFLLAQLRKDGQMGDPDAEPLDEKPPIAKSDLDDDDDLDDLDDLDDDDLDDLDDLDDDLDDLDDDDDDDL